jgi:long-chain acyl-CoA synthetase
VNLASIIDDHDGQRVAIISRNESTTYDELRARTDRERARLAQLGLADGDRIAIVCSNGLPFAVTYLAALGLGLVVVPLNPTSPGPELEHQLRAISAKAIVVDRSAVASWRHVDRAAVPSLEHVLTVDEAELDDATGSLDRPDGEEGPAVAVADLPADHLAVLMFTSGTAGSPRAAMLTHGNLLANLDQIRATTHRTGPDDVTYGVIPLFHIFGLNVVLGTTLQAGGTLVLVQRFDPDTALESIRARGVTVVPGAPSMWVAFSHFEEAPADAFATVRVAYSGAAKLPVATSRLLEERFGLVVAEGYGLTEASPTVTTSTGLQPKYGSVGAVLDGIELRIVDEVGQDALVGDAGEIWVRGPNVFAGYLDDPEATARVLTPDGWLRTGDIGYCDDEGFVYLVDRAKDLVIVSGFNVYPAEVEDVLAKAPGVAEVGVIGVPHPHTGEAVKAFVVAEPGVSVDEETLIEFAHEHLARYKCPSKILVVDELPRNANGKLLRRALNHVA